MSRPYEVKRSAEETIGRFTVIMDTLCVDGKERPYSYICEHDFICVLPICGDSVVYLRQYRHAIDAWKLEFPCGVIDSGETPAHAAVRELLEETGYRADQLTSLGWIHAKAGTSTAKAHLFLARCSPVREQSLDPVERIEVLSCSLSVFSSLIDNGEFDHVYGLIAWYRSVKKLKGFTCEQSN